MKARIAAEMNEIIAELNQTIRELNEISGELSSFQGIGSELCMSKIDRVAQKYEGIKWQLHRSRL